MKYPKFKFYESSEVRSSRVSGLSKDIAKMISDYEMPVINAVQILDEVKETLLRFSMAKTRDEDKLYQDSF